MTVTVEVGQTVLVTERYGKPLIGTVVKVARVWIDVKREGMSWGWRFRLDTQTDGSSVGSPIRFYTLDQWAERERKLSALAFLREQRISIEPRFAVA